MRVLLIGLIIWAALAVGAMAQTGYTYQPSGLEFTSTTPVEAGETVKGLILLSTGITALGDIYVNQLYTDDLFAYWEGIYKNKTYYYDIYSGYWKPGSITYQRYILTFQGEPVEGWLRSFGGFVDADHFFGQDGVLYQRINITRNRKRHTSRRREIIYSYYVNTQTMERSDSTAPAYRYIGNEPDVVIATQIDDQEAKLEKIIDEYPAFPMWETQAFEAPDEVVSPDGIDPNSPSLLEMIEGEIGPLEESDSTEVQTETTTQSTTTESKS